jgi:hypothetical protein
MPDHLTPGAERELAALDDALGGRPVAPDLADLGDLALLLRDDRPRPSGEFTAALDTRVRRGFSSGGPRRRASRPRWGGWFTPAMGLAATALVIAAVVIAVPRGDGGGSLPSGGGAGDSTAATESAGDDAAGGGSVKDFSSPAPDASGSVIAPPASAAPAPQSGSPGSDGRRHRQVERSASITLAALPRDVDAVSARVQEITRQQGGFVAASTVEAYPDGGGGTFQLRIPTRNLDAAMAALSRLGDVRERSQRSQDITARTVSTRSALTDARTERANLLEQLADATTLQEAGSIRARLRLVSREIEEARADVRRVHNRAAYSTVAVTLVADDRAGTAGAHDDTWTPGDAARDAWRLLGVAAGVGLIVVALGIPLALLAALAAAALRWTRRRRRGAVLDAV